jgi:hypothetical protein
MLQDIELIVLNPDTLYPHSLQSLKLKKDDLLYLNIVVLASLGFHLCNYPVPGSPHLHFVQVRQL